jgi:Flp pilus assembly protein TadG
MSRIRNLWRQLRIGQGQEEGQALVEFALVLIFVVIPFTFAFIETSVILYKYVALTNAAREGARAGSIYLHVGNPNGSFAEPDVGRSADVAEMVRATLGPFIVRPPDCLGTTADTTCQISYESGDPTLNPLRSTDRMTITIIHAHPYLFGALGSEIDLRAQTSMRIEPSIIISGTP